MVRYILINWRNHYKLSERNHASYPLLTTFLSKIGVRGRLIWQSTVLLLEGILVIVFAYAGTLATSIVVLILFSIFVQAAEGSTYG